MNLFPCRLPGEESYVCHDCGLHLGREEWEFLPWALEIWVGPWYYQDVKLFRRVGIFAVGP